jgi:ferredoxin
MHRKNVILHFSPQLVNQPILCGLIRGHQVDVNLLQASVEPDTDGTAFIQLEGQVADVNRALDYLKKIGVRLIFPAKNLIYDEDRCTHCGACVAHCLAQALTADPKTNRISFEHDKCLACELCIAACPFAALKSVSEHLGIKNGQ